MVEVRKQERMYTPGRVWELLTEGSEDADELIDLQVGLTKLNPAKGIFLVRLGQGYTAIQAMSEAGLTGNSTRLKQSAVRKLSNLMNGED